MKRLPIVAVHIFLLCSLANGQAFSSGSTGADGPLDLTSGDRVVQLPESGVLHYTTVNIPTGRTLSFASNSRNTPVTMLAQGAIVIGGTIAVSSSSECVGGCGFCGTSPRKPGQGGFWGGQANLPGFGPGGGVSGNLLGRWVGALSLVPIIGGSGGAGGGGNRGGCGGGAIVLASSTSIILSGQIAANGSIDYTCSTAGVFSVGGSGSGSGGAIRLVANSISVTVSGQLVACAVTCFQGCGINNQNCGAVRLEAPLGALTFSGTSNPAAVLSTINPIVVSSTPPSLTIASVGGFPVPSYAGQRFDTVDLLLPSQLTDPINVVVQGSNIPVGTTVNIGVINGSPSATTTPAALQGTFASSSASPAISNLNRTAVTYLLASATFDPPPPSAPFNQKGANYVDRVRVESLIGAKPKFVFLRKDGSEIKPEMLAKEFLQQFGQ